jgi:pimeloyl-ACP methyl ester carboxylesterase
MCFNSMVYQDETVKHPGIMGEVKRMLQSKEYTLKDIYNTFYKGFKLVYKQPFIEDLQHVDVLKSLKEVNIPVTFIHGKKDVHVSGELIEAYVDQLIAHKGKQLIWGDKSSHMFHPDDTKMIEACLIAELKHASK